MFTIIKHLVGSKATVAGWVVLSSSLALTQYMIPNLTIINDVEAARRYAHVAGPQHTVRRRAIHRHHHRRGLAIGRVVAALPPHCTVIYVDSNSYHTCDNVYYRPYYEGNTLIYVVVDKP